MTDTQTPDRTDQEQDQADRPNPNFIDNDLDRVPDRAFRDYALDDRLVDALEDKGITHPFPIQELTLPVALQGQDIIGQARTGTGKTLGFGLPLIMRLDPDAGHTQALIVTPTRELCLQVHDDLRICETMGFTSTTVYGGVGYEEQNEALQGGVDLVVGTPGRLLDQLGRGNLDLSQVGCVVLDEADEMLDMGFLPDVERLLNAANQDHRHTMLFSATMPASVVKLARRYTDNPLFMGADSVDNETAPTVDQHFFQVFRMDKPRVLARILQQPDRGNAMVFTRTKAMADRLVRELDDLGVSAIAIHGDLRQAAREKNLGKFRSADVDVLCATEVAARGMDIDNVTHVVNYDLPNDEKMYLHRIGRTARAGNAGAAITFADHSEQARLQMIKSAVQQDEVETLEVFSTSDELAVLFDLPGETPWEHMAKSSGGGRGRGSGSSRSGDGGGRRSRSHSRGSLDDPRGDLHDSDLDSDHDRSRDRSRREGTSLRTRVRNRTDDRDGGTSTTDTDAGDSRGGGDHGRQRSRSRSRSGDSTSRDHDSDSSSRRKRSSRSSGSSKGSGSGRVRARGGKPVDGGGSSDRSSRGRGSSSGSNGRSSRGAADEGSSGSGRRRNRRNRTSSSAKGGDGSRRNRGGGQQGDSSSAKAGHDGQVDLPRSVRPTSAGSEARGGGSPRLGRRVQVDDLP